MLKARLFSILLMGAVACDSSITEDAGPAPDASMVADSGPRTPDAAGADTGADASLPDAFVPDAFAPDAELLDASPFPIKVAYSAAAEDPLVLELYLTDTSTSRAKVNGPMAGGRAGGDKQPETGGLQSFAWSSDGQRLLYTAQEEVFDLVELYAAAAGARRPGPRRKLSVPGSDSDADLGEPSFVSERIAFTQHVDASTNLYVVSSTAASPIARRVSQGYASRQKWSPTADQLAYFDILQSMNDPDLWFAQVHPGAPPPERVNTGANRGFAGVLAWAPDGSTFVYAADDRALGIYELYWVSVDAGLLGPRQVLHAPFPANSDVAFVAPTPAAYSPDGSKIAYLANPRLPGTDDLHLIDLVGGVPSAPIVISSTSATELGVARFSFDPSGTWLVYATRRPSSDAEQLFLVPADGSVPATPVSPPVSDGAFLGETWARNGESLVFAFDAGAGVSLYAVDLAMGVSRRPVQVSHLLALGAPGVQRWDLSPDQRWLIYDAIEADDSRVLYSVDLTDLSRPIQHRVHSGTTRPSWCWPRPPNGALAAVIDLETPGVRELYWVANVAQPSFVKLSGPLVAGGRVSECAFAP